MPKTSINPVDDFIASQPQEFRKTLEELRAYIKSLVPGAEEMISYQVPCFKYIYMLVGFGVNKNFCSLYTMSSNLVKAMKGELTGVKASGNTIHFIPNEPLPKTIIKKIVTARIKENEEIAASRKK